MTSSSELFEFAPLSPSAALPPAAAVVGPAGASQRAIDIVTQAEVRATQIEASARQEGFAQGYAEGAAAARAELQPALAALAAAVESAEAAREAFVESAERHAVELALVIAEKVVAAHVETTPEAVLTVVTGALRRVTEREHLVVEVNPQDFELVRSAAEDLAASLGGIARLEVLSERRVARGGCVARTAQGEIDAQIDVQLGAVRDLFAAADGEGHDR
jgi:flagellar assembly protein FliH